MKGQRNHQYRADQETVLRRRNETPHLILQDKMEGKRGRGRRHISKEPEPGLARGVVNKVKIANIRQTNMPYSLIVEKLS